MGPVDGCRYLVRIGQLQRIDHANDFLEVAAGARRAGDREPHLLVGRDDEDRAYGERRVGLRMDHPIEICDLAIGVGKDGKLAACPCVSSMSCSQDLCESRLSTDRPMVLTLRRSNSGLSFATSASSVVQSGVKSFGCENSTPQLSPSQT